MAKSLDGLIHYLLDQIALCGEQGASPSDFISYVTSYYSSSTENEEFPSGQAYTDNECDTANIDRPFLEQVWKWLTKNPEIRLGEHAGHHHLTLSDVEARNDAIRRGESSDAGLRTSDVINAVVSSEGSRTVIGRHEANTDEENINAITHPSLAFTLEGQPSEDPNTNDDEATVLPHEPSTLSRDRVPDKTIRHDGDDQPSSKPKVSRLSSDKHTTKAAIRIYTSEARMWHALAGHGPDYNKIKALDFACLSIIAAHRYKGIYQHDLVKLSGQDPRSLPARTDRLHDDGYIKKKRVKIQQIPNKRLLHTSHVVLKRFIEDTTNRSVQETAGSTSANAATRTIDGDEDESQHRRAPEESAPSISKPISTPIPQWTPDRPLGNQIYDVVYQSGIDGMSMTSIREHLFGEHVRKPADEYIYRLVDCWQISQPLHLRHLSIVRDTKMQGKTSIYIYFAYEHFKALVERGTVFWEAVTTVSEEVMNGCNVTSSLDASPKLDEYGFPVLELDLFQGHDKGTSLEDSVSALNAGRLRVAGSDPILKMQTDGSHGIQYKESQSVSTPRRTRDPCEKVNSPRPKSRSTQAKDGKRKSVSSPYQVSAPKPPIDEPMLSGPKRPRDLIVKKKGRPRKYPKTGAPTDVTTMEPFALKRLQASQEMAEKYARNKIGEEITWRLQGGRDSAVVVREVIAEAEALRSEEEQQPLLSYTKEMLLHTFSGGPEPEPFNSIPSLPGKKPRGRGKRAPYWPSMAAHTIFVPQNISKGISVSSHLQMAISGGGTSVSRKRRLPADLREPEIEADPAPTQKRRYRRRIALPAAESVDPLSMAAHDPQLAPQPASVPNDLGEKPKRKPGRPARSKDVGGSLTKIQPSGQAEFQHLPPKAGHSESYVPSPSPMLGSLLSQQRAQEVPIQTQDILKSAGETSFPPQIRYRPSIAAHSPSSSYLSSNQRPAREQRHIRQGVAPPAMGTIVTDSELATMHPTRRASPQSPVQSAIIDPEGQYPGWIKFMSKYYEPELRLIRRQHDGVSVGAIRPRRKRGCEPAGFRPRSFQLVIIKTARLQSLSWFAEADHPKSGKSRPVRSRLVQSSTQPVPPSTSEQSLVTPIREVIVQPWTPINQPSLTPLSFHQPHHPQHSNALMSPYTEMDASRRRDLDELGRGKSTQSFTDMTSLERDDLSARITHTQDAEGRVRYLKALETASTLHNSTSSLSNSGIAESSSLPGQTSNSASDRVSPSFLGERSDYTGNTDHASHDIASIAEKPFHVHVEDLPPVIHQTEEDTMDAVTTVTDSMVSADNVPPPSMEITNPQNLGPPRAASHGDLLAQNPTAISADGRQVNIIQGSAFPQSPYPTTSVLLEAGDNGVHVQDLRPLQKSLRQTPRPGREVSKSRDGENLLVPTSVLPGPSPTQVKPSPSRTSIKKISRKGGSLAILRKNIVMQIMGKCGGIFGGTKEMVKPFQIEWKKNGMTGRPEDDTLQHAVIALCAEGKLRQIDFPFKSTQGKLINKRMIIHASISPFDQRVKDFQRNMMAYYPMHFMPAAMIPREEPSLLDEHRARLINAGKDYISQRISKGKGKAAEAKVAAMKAEEERQRDDPKEVGDGTTNPVLRGSLDPVRRVPNVLTVSPSHTKRSTPVKRPRGGKVERLASIRRPPPATAARSSIPPLLSLSSKSSRELTWLPEAYAFSDLNLEEERPTVLGPSMSGYTRRLHARYGSRMDLSELNNRPHLGSHALQQIRGTAETLNQRESTKNITSIRERSLLSNVVRPSFSGSPYTTISPHLDASQSHLQSATTQLGYRSCDSQSDVDSDKDSVGSSMDDAQVSKEPKTKSSPLLTLSQAEQSQKMGLRKKPLASFMHAVHYFHQTTGTFSVAYSGVEPPQRINNKVGTCSRPYSLGPRIFHSHTDFPTSRAPKHLTPVRDPGADDTQFEKEVDDALTWELNTVGLEDVVIRDLPFVNHTFNHPYTTVEAQPVKMNSMKEVYQGNGRLVNRPFPSITSTRSNIRRVNLSHGPKKSPAKAGKGLQRNETQNSRKRRRLTSLTDDTSQQASLGAELLDEDHRPSKIQKVGAAQDKWPSDHDLDRFLTAVIVVRTLTGGLEKLIDWVLVAKAFDPIHTEKLTSGGCNYHLQKAKLRLPKMEEDFRELFLTAYKNDVVPTLNYDKLTEYDWSWLTDWAMPKLISKDNPVPDLPATREEFDRLYIMKPMPENDNHDYYEVNGAFKSSTEREQILAHSAYVIPMPQKHKETPSQVQQQLDTAKTWLRANVITPESTYNPGVAYNKLAELPNEVVQKALKQALAGKVLSKANKGRLIPGRNYDISDHFLKSLEKNQFPACFQRAIEYKSYLDHEFLAGRMVPHPEDADHAEDGDMLTILNLLAHKRVTLKASNVPLNKWGQTDGKYESRHMDKSRLNFQVAVKSVPAYIYGNPLLPLPTPPSQHLNDNTAKIPLWYDIHGSFVPEMWELVLPAVVALVVIRPGIGAADLQKLLHPSLGAWEIELVMQWMVDANAAERVGSGYTVSEWWWLVFEKHGEDEEDGLSAGNIVDKEKRKERAADDIPDGQSMDLGMSAGIGLGKGKGKERAVDDVPDGEPVDCIGLDSGKGKERAWDDIPGAFDEEDVDFEDFDD